jgi:hypothetical protein
MASRLAASILVRLVDQASGPAAKIARALRNIDKVAKSASKGKTDFGFDRSASKNVDRVAASMRRLSRDMKSVGKIDFKVSPSAVNSIRVATSHARRLTMELRSASNAARSIHVNLAGSRGSPFGAMRRDLQAALRDMQRLNAMSARMGRRGGGAGGYGPGGGGVGGGRGRGGHGAAGGYVAVRAAEATVGGARRAAGFAGKAGANAMREDARDYLAGLKPGDTDRLHKTAVSKSSEYTSVDSNTLHEMLRDTAMSMGSVDKSVDNSDNLARMAVVMQSQKGPEKAIENVRQFYSALDVLGKNVDPKVVKELSNAYTKATGVEGAEMDMGKLLKFAKQSRSAGASLSNEFLMSAVPALMQDLGADQTGNAISTGLSQVVAGRATKQSKAKMAAIGLRDENMNMSRKDTEMFLSDPQEYALKRLIPAISKLTIGQGKDKRKVNADNDQDVAFAMTQLFSNKNVGDLFTKLITQREQYARKRQQYQAAPGTDAAPELSRRDPYVALKAVGSQATNVAAEALKPYMQPATDAMDKAASALGALAKSMAENPNESKIATPLVAGVVGTVAAWLAGTGLTALAGNSPGLAAGAARLAGGALTGGAGAVAGSPLIAGAVGGAVLDNNVSQIGGADTLRSWNESLERRKGEAMADAVLKSTGGVGAFDRNKKMGSLGSSLDGYTSSYDQSGGVVQDFLFGRKKGSMSLPGFGFQGVGGSQAALPGQQPPVMPPRRPGELGGAPASADSVAATSLPKVTAHTEAISAATAEVAKFEAELGKAKAQLDGLKSSGEGAFSPETFTLESKVSELQTSVDAAKSKLNELNAVSLTTLDGAVDATKLRLDQLGSVSVTPKVDPSSIQGAVGIVDDLLSKLAQVGSASAAATSAVQRTAAAAGAAASSAARATASLTRSQQTSMTSSPA